MMCINSEVYEEKLKLSYSDFDRFDKILPSALLRLFQDVAGRDCDRRNVGFSDMIKQDALWIISKIHIEFIKEITYGEEYLIKTWPLKRRLLFFPREFAMYDKNGELVLKSMSIWHTMSNTTRQLVNPQTLHIEGLEDLRKDSVNFDNWNVDFDKEECLLASEEKLSHQVVFTELDHNGHLNNTHYADIAQDSLKEHVSNKRLKEMTLLFVNECKKDELIKTFYRKEQDIEYIKGVKDEEPVFFASFLIGD